MWMLICDAKTRKRNKNGSIVTPEQEAARGLSFPESYTCRSDFNLKFPASTRTRKRHHAIPCHLHTRFFRVIQGCNSLNLESQPLD